MNMDHFVYFIETVKNNSLTVAAQKLYINQSEHWKKSMILNLLTEQQNDLN